MLKGPTKTNLTQPERLELEKRINNSNLPDADKNILVGTLDFNHWLQRTLLEKDISISRLNKLIFGEEAKNKRTSKSDKNRDKSGHKNTDSASSDESTLADEETTVEQLIEERPASEASNQDVSEYTTTDNDEDKIVKTQHPGRLGYQDYSNKTTIIVNHDRYKAGDECPELYCNGRLSEIRPGNVIKIVGQSLAQVNHYKVEKLRCNLCSFYIKAQLPPEVSENKYDHQFKSQLSLFKYQLGMPFYRLENYQSMLGVPLPDSTQWDLVEQVADKVYPIFNHLEYLAAQGRLVHLDDTTVRILACKKQESADKKERTGTFTTGVLSYYQQQKIYLFYNSRKHAGENMTNLLAKRETESPIQYMCDALSRNMPKNLKVILINCLAHGHRKFKEIDTFFPKPCQFVIDKIKQVYQHDEKTTMLTPAARLLHHQKYSKPIMDELHIWLIKQIEERLVEPNSSLGKAITYLLKHWPALTQFLKIPGAPLDNNILEQALKIPIRIRKNALFYKSEHGGYVGGILLSLIQTCSAAKINPVKYLTVLQDNSHSVFAAPENWLPWNYMNQFSDLHASDIVSG